MPPANTNSQNHGLYLLVRKTSKGGDMMNSRNGATVVWLLLVAGVVCAALLSLSAQVQTQNTTTAGQPTVQAKVDRAEVVTVSGNDLIVKMEDGTIRHFANVP